MFDKLDISFGKTNKNLKYLNIVFVYKGVNVIKYNNIIRSTHGHCTW